MTDGIGPGVSDRTYTLIVISIAGSHSACNAWGHAYKVADGIGPGVSDRTYVLIVISIARSHSACNTWGHAYKVDGSAR